MVTFKPRDSRIAPRDAAAMPLPREDTTPPVTNTYLVIAVAADMAAQVEIGIITGLGRAFGPIGATDFRLGTTPAAGLRPRARRAATPTPKLVRMAKPPGYPD
ncbi:hypothetical protein GCM10025795_20090 [Verticiella sediminum]